VSFLSNKEFNSAKQAALAQLESMSKNFYEQTSVRPSGTDFFAPEAATVKTLREFMELTAAAMTELNEQIQSNERAAEKRHEEILASSKASSRFNWPNFICAVIAALGVLVPACVWLISHLCSNV
jgi:hypothetical protein